MHDLCLVLNTESAENSEADSGNCFKSKSKTEKKCLKSLPYFKKCFSTDNLSLIPSNVVVIYSKVFCCLGPIRQTLKVFQQVVYRSRQKHPPCGKGKIPVLLTKLMKRHSTEQYLNKKIEQSENE